MFNKYKESILYLIFGVLSTGVNISTYYIGTRVLSLNLIIANITAWVAAIFFSYVTNKIFVFESEKKDIKHVLKEFKIFVNCRVISLLIEIFMMYVLIKILLANDVIVKIFTNIIVIIMNYAFSKILVFKKD